MTFLLLTLLWTTDVVRPLQGCDRDVHQIYLGDGEALEGSVEQIGVNVTIDFVDPDGRELLHVNNRDEGRGIESFLLGAGRSGQ